ncbi:MAG: hypothetical protein EBR82_27500 [Caulobacteraceae bacterium]|nr:hypothetical protein [Caulobacteraceae bacterium]
MTDTTEHPFPDEQAAEYALGVQTAAERTEAERRMASDPAFADEVGAWNERLAPMIDEVAPVRPPRVVWLRIAAQLGLTKTPANDNAGFWGNIAVWRAGTAVFAVAAAAALTVMVLTPEPTTPVASPVEQPAPVLTAVGLLKPSEDGPTSFVVTFDKAAQRLIIAPVTGPSPKDRSYELWMLPDGTAPVSMGVLDGTNVVTIDARRLIGPNGETRSLAISLEPRGGSPTGAPTGPVIASGALKAI